MKGRASPPATAETAQATVIRGGPLLRKKQGDLTQAISSDARQLHRNMKLALV